MADLQDAIAELRRVSPEGGWTAAKITAEHPEPMVLAGYVAATLNAVLSGDLIPRADAELAVAGGGGMTRTVCSNCGADKPADRFKACDACRAEWRRYARKPGGPAETIEALRAAAKNAIVAMQEARLVIASKREHALLLASISELRSIIHQDTRHG